jgi:pilus assembly protein CpaB
MSSSPEIISQRAVARIRAKALAFLVLSGIVGVGAVYLVKWYLDRVRSGALAATAPTVDVVVAASPLPIGTTLAEQHLVVLPWPAGQVPEGTFDKPSLLVGRTLVHDLVKGEAVLKERLADEGAGRGLAALLKPGFRAMAVKVDQVVGIAGFVQPGDRVDVVTTMTPDDETREVLQSDAAKISKIILQNVGVLAIGEHTTSEGSKPVSVQVVTLEVSPGQSERLALASRHGDIQLIMRSRVDPAPVPTAGLTPLALLAPDAGAEGAGPVRRDAPAVVVEEARPAPVRKFARGAKPVEAPLPVVEILRGGRVEERKLRRTPDAGFAGSDTGVERLP